MGLPQHSSKSNEWYTPLEVMTLAHQMFTNGIDLDPASCCFANRNFIKAKKWFSIEDNGLERFDEWVGTIWLNPFYGRNPGALIWAKAIEKAYSTGVCNEALVLLRDSTPSAFYLQRNFVHWRSAKRIAFVNIHKEKQKSPPHCSTIIYLGENTRKFHYLFSNFMSGSIFQKSVVGVEPTNRSL